MKTKSPTKIKKVKRIKAWLVIKKDYFAFCGNGKQYQAPIFKTKSEALEFKKEPHGYYDGKVVLCEITYSLK